jgi:hypothetical protein
MKNLVGYSSVKLVGKSNEIKSHRSLWIKKEGGSMIMCSPPSFKNKKFKNQKKRQNDRPNSVNAKYYHGSNDENKVDSRNKSDHQVKDNGTKYNTKQKDIIKVNANHYFDKDIIKWNCQQIQTQSKRTSNTSNINKNKLKEFQEYIDKSKRTKKQRVNKKHHSSANRHKTVVTKHNKTYEIDSRLIEDKNLLEEWIKKIESKRNYNDRNKNNRVSNMSSNNQFSVSLLMKIQKMIYCQ